MRRTQLNKSAFALPKTNWLCKIYLREDKEEVEIKHNLSQLKKWKLPGYVFTVEGDDTVTWGRLPKHSAHIRTAR